MFTLYSIKNTANNKYYYGVTNNFSKRKSSHLCKLRKNQHVNTHLQKDFNNFEEHTFEFEPIIIHKNKAKILELEYKIIKNSKTKLYNELIGQNLSESHKRNLSKALKERYKGSNNSNYDSKIYTFYNNESNKEFTGTRQEFINKYNLCRSAVGKLISKKS